MTKPGKQCNHSTRIQLLGLLFSTLIVSAVTARTEAAAFGWGTPGLEAAASASIKVVTKQKKGVYKVEVECPHFDDQTRVGRYANDEANYNADGSLHLALQQIDPYGDARADGTQKFDTQKVKISLNTKELVSYFTTEEASNFGHQMMVFCYSYGMVEGSVRKLSINDIFTEGSDWKAKLARPFISRLKSSPNAKELMSSTFSQDEKECFEDWSRRSEFVLSKSGIECVLGARQNKSGNFEPSVLSISFSEIQGIDKKGPLKPLFNSANKN